MANPIVHVHIDGHGNIAVKTPTYKGNGCHAVHDLLSKSAGGKITHQEKTAGCLAPPTKDNRITH